MLKLYRRVTFEQKPPSPSELLFHNMTRTENSINIRKPSIKYKSLSAKTSNAFLHRTTAIYNTLPYEIRTKGKKQFSKLSKVFLRNNFNPKIIPKTNDYD